jgi:hypothetical protein
MTCSDSATEPLFLGWNERRWIVLFCVVAAVRVFILCAAFPFFNNVDEQEHFDLVMRYSRGEVPRTLPMLEHESVGYVALAGSPEYRLRAEQFPGGKFPRPLWQQSSNRINVILEQRMKVLAKSINHEAQSPPVYYALAALWMNLGRMVGLEPLFLLYWIRFLNVPIAVGIVCLAFIAVRAAFPERPVARFLAPGLAAVFPQSALYSIENDVLSPLFLGYAFVCIVLWLRKGEMTIGLAIACGAALGAACLTKLSNLPMIGAITLFVAITVWEILRRGESGLSSQRILPPCLIILVAASIMAFWFGWSAHAFGDVTGTKSKIAVLGWTAKPFREYWSHPIFTPRGLWMFFSNLIPTFWRGEFVWFDQRLASPLLDAFYSVSTAVLFAFAIAGIWMRRQAPDEQQRKVLWLSALCIALSVMFLAWISIRFDFGACRYPSRAYPYLTSGRLIIGALLPFLLLYAYGFDRLTGGLHERWRQLLAVILILLVLISGIAINSPAFSSTYNWFNLVS